MVPNDLFELVQTTTERSITILPKFSTIGRAPKRSQIDTRKSEKPGRVINVNFLQTCPKHEFTRPFSELELGACSQKSVPESSPTQFNLGKAPDPHLDDDRSALAGGRSAVAFSISHGSAG